MRSVSETFAAWKDAARAALAAGVAPAGFRWEPEGEAEPELVLERAGVAREPASRPRVPRAFVETAKLVAAHSSSGRWRLLYRILWRILHGEPRLLDVEVDRDVAEFRRLEGAVRREIHKMRAFVRFRPVEREGQEWLVAWFEPEHDVVEQNARFFCERFASMRWAILTPRRSVSWDGTTLEHGPGVEGFRAPDEDGVEDLWRRYYASIFNPARSNLAAMRREMPTRYWKNLPETDVVSRLAAEAPKRSAAMIAASDAKRTDTYPIRPAEPPPGADLGTLAAAAQACTACPIHREATQAVFGEGPRDAAIVFVGEQPGDQEDLAGRPFVGPAGQLFDRALAEAGIDRSRCYVTNAVKHFKWSPRAKRRIHEKPNAREARACRPWLEAELQIVSPRVLVCLGRTAAESVFGAPVRIGDARGRFAKSTLADRTLVTVHPSALLRAPDEEARRREYEAFVGDLRRLKQAVSEEATGEVTSR